MAEERLKPSDSVYDSPASKVREKRFARSEDDTFADCRVQERIGEVGCQGYTHIRKKVVPKINTFLLGNNLGPDLL